MADLLPDRSATPSGDPRVDQIAHLLHIFDGQPATKDPDGDREAYRARAEMIIAKFRPGPVPDRYLDGENFIVEVDDYEMVVEYSGRGVTFGVASADVDDMRTMTLPWEVATALTAWMAVTTAGPALDEVGAS